MSGKWVELALIASGQGGLFTAAQAGGVGYSHSHLAKLQAAGRVSRVYRGVYEVCGNAWDRWQDLRAVWLSVTKGGSQPAVVSHQTAAHLWQIGVLASPRYEFTVPDYRKVSDRAVSLHVGRLESSQVDRNYGLPVTSPVQTVYDIVESGVDGDHLGYLIRDALLQYDHPVTDYVTALTPFAAGYGCSDGQSLVEYVLGLVSVPDRVVVLLQLAVA